MPLQLPISLKRVFHPLLAEAPFILIIASLISFVALWIDENAEANCEDLTGNVMKDCLDTSSDWRSYGVPFVLVFAFLAGIYFTELSVTLCRLPPFGTAAHLAGAVNRKRSGLYRNILLFCVVVLIVSLVIGLIVDISTGGMQANVGLLFYQFLVILVSFLELWPHRRGALLQTGDESLEKITLKFAVYESNEVVLDRLEHMLLLYGKAKAEGGAPETRLSQLLENIVRLNDEQRATPDDIYNVLLTMFTEGSNDDPSHPCDAFFNVFKEGGDAYEEQLP